MEIAIMSKMSWYDIQVLNHNELKKKYKTDDNGLEKGIRPHMDGANAQERRDLYKTVWDKKEK
jgi:hypothetical protein